ncbi:MAG TPA: RNA degradosome polyphosphate kinase [Candidatus Dormibacteraeota bacterium]|nr:RNA degradosome polyphosphate kinase [Candidatus Dormibacteraeota bacterium]
MPKARRRLEAVPHRYLNRELSWLDFNERVLALAEDTSTPLLERAKFLAIFAGNLDEFFMVRVAGLRRQLAAGLAMSRSSDGLTTSEQLARIRERVANVADRHARLFADQIHPALAAAGVRITRWDDLSKPHRASLQATFSERIFPVLTPLAVDPGHPFPYISNLSLNLAVLVEDPETKRQRHFARVKVPPLLGRFVTPEEGIFVPLEDVIAANLDRLFPGMRIVEHHAFRVTRDADLEIDDDGAEDLLEALEDELRRRRLSPAVRLEVEASMPGHVLELLMRELQVFEADVQALPGPLNLAGLWELHAIDRPDLKDAPFQPRTHPELLAGDDLAPDIFAAISRHDILLHHPYDAFATSVQRFIEQAAADPGVLAIKQTLYRTSGDSPIVDALVQAAGAGKQVVVLVEIKARFDEQNNIGWARVLEQAGCHVVYGVMGLKTHAKLCLVVREEVGKLRRYVHVGTGNYNPTTARIYEDFGLLTASPRLGADVSSLFNFLTGYARDPDYKSLIVAPRRMRQRLVELIEREAQLSTPATPGRIVMKLNNLVDEAIIDALYAAAVKGVQIDLIIRATCALRPGVPGMSDSIRVHSIVGRFLEHSRILVFGNGGDEELYVGSADLMHRNLDRRVETLVRVESGAARRKLNEVLGLALRDNVGTWQLDGDGAWSRLEPGEDPSFSLQATLMERSGHRA